jgi:probable addiction module antidote protein
METGDAAFVRDALGIVARAVGPSKVAIAAHLNRVSLYKALGPTGNPGFATVMGILGALGLTMSVRPAGRRKKHPAKAVSGIVAKSKPPHYHFSRRAD